ncbi:MAG: RNA 2',3'-cyclic phosphodiesterase [Nitrospirota bacterium]|nr:RNA 2',3'-cyclic phosphodiesterase [Nitrospirota bacterium]
MALRCFIAIEIPEGIRGHLSDIANILMKSGADVKWVSPENIHLTLQFLGITEEALIPKIKEALDKILAPYLPFYIKILDVGCFPDGRRPRVVWLGVEESQPLRNLYKDIADAMEKLGYKKEEREFTPHVTIGRVKSNRNILALARKLEEVRSVRFSDFEVRNITLMKSELKPSGAKYYSLAEIPFGGRSNVS